MLAKHAKTVNSFGLHGMDSISSEIQQKGPYIYISEISRKKWLLVNTKGVIILFNWFTNSYTSHQARKGNSIQDL